MRIVHIIDSVDPSSGGPTAVVLRLGIAQAGLGHEVDIVGACPAGQMGVLDSYLKVVPGADAVRLHVVEREHSFVARLRTGAFVHTLRGVVPGSEVMHLHGIWDPGVIRAAGVARSEGIPYVVMPHGMLDHWSLARSRAKKALFRRIAVDRMIERAASIHCLNQHEADTIGELGFRARQDVIPNGVFLDEVLLETEENEFRESIPGLGDKPYFLFLSRLHFKKGLDILAGAWEQIAAAHPDLRLVVAGPCEDDSAADFERRIESAGLSDSVFLPGPIYGTRKTAAFRESLAFVLPSRQEGFSIAITEALGLGSPVVITHGCHFPEVEQAGAGIVTELDAGAFGEAMVRVAEDDGLRAGMGERAARLVRENYTWPRIAELTMELYGQIGSASN